jgi:hypothetical protein
MVADSAHPWASRHPLAPPPLGARARLLPASARLAWNSAFPDGESAGPVWAGRGVTAEARAGAALRAGPLWVRVEPVLFWAENRAFPLMENGREGAQAYADGRRPTTIDLPQRFGGAPYMRLDPGESTVSLTAGSVSAGVSTAAQQWGPGRAHPLVLGTHAGGYPHAFVETATPVNVGIGRLHGRVAWGRLAHSEYTVMADSAARFASGAVVVFVPRGLPGLELGATRFFHLAWPEGGPGVAELLAPFGALAKASVDSTGLGADGRSGRENQLASVFARWVLPRAGLEVYGEYAREDHAWDLQDFLLEPDHARGYMLGFRKAWSPGGRLAALRGEVVNTRPSHVDAVRLAAPFYVHTGARQGHTHRGQVLGSPFAYGGGGSVLGFDMYHPRGRWSVEWSRARAGGGETRAGLGGPADVLHTLGAEVLLLRRGVDVSAAVAGTANLNRYHLRDVYNLNASLGVRVGT